MPRPWIHRLCSVLLPWLLGIVVGCGGPRSAPADSTPEPGVPAAQTAPATPPPSPTPSPSPEAATTAPRVVFLGDSLTAGYSLPAEQAFPFLVGQALREQGLPIEVLNAGVSGDTSAGGLRRLDWLLRQKPAILVVGLGGNDGLRGLPLADTEANLQALVEQARQGGAKVLLLGMRIPPNYGADYAEGFAAIFPRLAARFDVPLVPFLLDGVGGHSQWNLPDGIHPNPAGHRRVADNIVPYLAPMVREIQPKSVP